MHVSECGASVTNKHIHVDVHCAFPNPFSTLFKTKHPMLYNVHTVDLSFHLITTRLCTVFQDCHKITQCQNVDTCK